MSIINYPPDAIMLADDEGVVTARIDHSPDYAYLRALYASKPEGLSDEDFPIPDVLVVRVDVVDVSGADPDYDRDDPDDPNAPQRYSFSLTSDHAVRLAHRLLELAPLASGDLTPREDQR